MIIPGALGDASGISCIPYYNVVILGCEKFTTGLKQDKQPRQS